MTAGQLLQPMRSWTARQANGALALYTALTCALACTIGWRMFPVFRQVDVSYYMDTARGLPSTAPFSSRQLGPLLARLTSHLLHVSLQTAFTMQGIVAIVFFVATVGFFLIDSGAPRWMLTVIGGMAFWSFAFNSLALPDLLYGALMSGFLLLLRRERLLAAALMMFPLMVARESTLVTLVCFLLAGWRRLRGVEGVTALAGLAAGMVLVKRLAANGAPNAEHIPPALYMMAKIPWNFARNVLGFSVWADVNPGCGVPRWKMPLHVGALHEVGFCGFDTTPIVLMIAAFLTVYGLLPLLAVRVLKLRSLRGGGREQMLLRFCVIYGGLSFVLATSLGASVARLLTYAWPLFLVAAPYLIAAARANFNALSPALLFVAMHLGLSWTVPLLYPQHQVPVGLVAYVAGWLILRRTFHEGAPGYPARTVPGSIPERSSPAF